MLITVAIDPQVVDIGGGRAKWTTLNLEGKAHRALQGYKHKYIHCRMYFSVSVVTLPLAAPLSAVKQACSGRRTMCTTNGEAFKMVLADTVNQERGQTVSDAMKERILFGL